MKIILWGHPHITSYRGGGGEDQPNMTEYDERGGEVCLIWRNILLLGFSFSTQKKYSRASGAEIFMVNYPSISPPQVPECRSKTVILGISELQNIM